MKSYLEKHRFVAPLFEHSAFNPDLIVCIPVLNEPHLTQTLASLKESAEQFEGCVLILVLFNHSEGSDALVKKANQAGLDLFAQAKKALESNRFKLQGHLISLPNKHAGVGLARKILMDDGTHLFTLSENQNGILVALDGDSLVAANYFQAIADFFALHPKLEAASIHFEHPMPTDILERNAIIQYELHLRYFIEAQRMARLPTAFQTIGSSMAVRHLAYQKQGGMNKRKAGEDFYFLQKFARKGTLGDLTDTTVYPSTRISDRVPFGTGRAMGILLNSPILMTHRVIIFDEVKLLLDDVSLLYDLSEQAVIRFAQALPTAIQAFLAENDFVDRIREIQKHTADSSAFVKRFFAWFDGFLMMKYVHFARDHYYPDAPVLDIAYSFAVREFNFKGNPSDSTALLEKYRAKNKLT